MNMGHLRNQSNSRYHFLYNRVAITEFQRYYITCDMVDSSSIVYGVKPIVLLFLCLYLCVILFLYINVNVVIFRPMNKSIPFLWEMASTSPCPTVNGPWHLISANS